MTQDTTKEKRSKWGLFSHKGDKEHNNNNHNPRFDAANSGAATFDSTYGGSEASATSDSFLGDNNHRNNNNKNKNRNDTANQNDNSQTVTTTTTTTTTTTSGPGSNNTSSLHNVDPSQQLGNNGHDYENTHRPSIPAKSTRRDQSPSMSGANYSRPSNSSPLSPAGAHPNALGSNPANSQYGQHSATLQGLKIAAAGIHGAGETLRGTVNSAVDRRFNEQPATVGAHQQIAEQGRKEIETGRLNHSASTATQNSYHPNVDGGGMPRKGILRKKVDDKDGSLRPVGF